MKTNDEIELLTLISDLGSSEDKSRQAIACEIKRLTTGIRSDLAKLQKAMEEADAITKPISAVRINGFEKVTLKSAIMDACVIWQKEYGGTK